MIAYCPHCRTNIGNEVEASWYVKSRSMVFECDCPHCGKEIEVHVVATFNVYKA